MVTTTTTTSTDRAEPARWPHLGEAGPRSDYERRYGRNWSETDTGGTSGMGASRTSGDRGPIGPGRATSTDVTGKGAPATTTPTPGTPTARSARAAHAAFGPTGR